MPIAMLLPMSVILFNPFPYGRVNFFYAKRAKQKAIAEEVSLPEVPLDAGRLEIFESSVACHTASTSL